MARRRSNAAAANPSEVLPNLGKKLGLAIGGTLFWCGITCIFVIFTASAFWNSWVAVSWHNTSGTITASSVEVHHSGRGATTSRPRIEYRYRVGEREYTGDRYNFLEISSNGPETGRVTGQYQPGSPVTVYYDPDDPSRAVLESGIPSMAWGLATFLQPFILIGVAMIFWTVRLPGKIWTTRRLLQPQVALPLQVPSWGTIRQTPEGFVVEPVRSQFWRALSRGLLVYGLLSFIGMFAVNLPYFFLGISPAALLAPVFAPVLGLSALVILHCLLKGRIRATVRIDNAHKVLTVAGQGMEELLRFDQIKSWRIKVVPYKYGLTIGSNDIQYLVVEALQHDNKAVPVHAFRGFGDLSLIRPVAHRMKDLFAGWTSGDSRESEAVFEPDDPPRPKPVAMVLGAWAALCGQKPYEDVT